MATWHELPDSNQGDPIAYTEAWENRASRVLPCGHFDTDKFEWCSGCGPVRDVEYADEDEAGQLGLGVPGEQRAIPTLARPVDAERCACGRELENGEHDGGYGAWCG